MGGNCCKGKKVTAVNEHDFSYDLVVIGGGSGGLAAAKQAGKDGLRVIVCDYVTPSPVGTTWGLGGTCTNVGCVPKKLLHAAALIADTLSSAPAFGFALEKATRQLTPYKIGVEHKWSILIEEVQTYIHKLNFEYRVKLNDNNVAYVNSRAQFVNPHVIQLTTEGGVRSVVSGNIILVAIGGRPKYLDIPGGRNTDALCITSDDIFSLPYPPGKTLIVGASYVALECAGFLNGLGYEVTIMVRSVLLRAFDREMAERIGDHLETLGVRILRKLEPIEIKKIEEGSPPRFQVIAGPSPASPTHDEIYNTIILAIGRDPSTLPLRIEAKAKVNLSPSGKIIVNESDQTNIPNIYAVGDCAEGRPELATLAIQAGLLLAKRISGGTTLTNYVNVPTTIYTPLEYGCIGYSEDEAVAKFGLDGLKVYHSTFQPLEYVIPNRTPGTCHAKLICLKSKKKKDGEADEKVVGLHYLGPDAGEVIQGFALAFKFKATKADYDDLIGVHPTCAERFTTLTNYKGSGKIDIPESC